MDNLHRNALSQFVFLENVILYLENFTNVETVTPVPIMVIGIAIKSEYIYKNGISINPKDVMIPPTTKTLVFICLCLICSDNLYLFCALLKWNFQNDGGKLFKCNFLTIYKNKVIKGQLS